MEGLAARQLVKIALLAELWIKRSSNDGSGLKESAAQTWVDRFNRLGQDVLRVLFTPLVLLMLELSALYGLFRPLDGRKLYASFEGLLYSRFRLAPCFQKEPIKHLFNSSPSIQNGL